MSLAKRIARKVLPPGVLHFAADKTRALRGKSVYSSLNEEIIIAKYLEGMPPQNAYCVDIAAGDGMSQSNTYKLFKSGWEGVAVEFDSNRFAKLADSYRRLSAVRLLRVKVFPQNVTSILASCSCPKDFAFLNLDIDSYDYYVLEKLLGDFRPGLMCVEINEKVPPPIRFTVLYDPAHSWALDHFYGQSISQCYELCTVFDYEIVELHYNNLFLVPRERNRYGSLTPEAAYDAGYRSKTDRKEKFPWNSDMEALLTMTHDDALDFLGRKFQKYSGKFLLE